jgi:hypothetical protein
VGAEPAAKRDPRIKNPCRTPQPESVFQRSGHCSREETASNKESEAPFPILSERRVPEDSESFNQLVRTIPLRTKGCVMSNLDRVSGSFLAVVVGGLAILCGGLIVIAIGY